MLRRWLRRRREGVYMHMMEDWGSRALESCVWVHVRGFGCTVQRCVREA